MSTRRKFIGTGIAGIAGLSLLPAVNTFASDNNQYNRPLTARYKFRFALASDIHYGQKDTDSDFHAGNMVKWINEDHAKNNFDMVIINGDLVHNQPGLLPVIKQKYLDKLAMPYYTIPGNHDMADASIWKTVFGYEDKYFFEMGDFAFVLANTANTNGDYVCPDSAFIKASLDKLTDKSAVFVVLHIPPVQWMKSEVTSFLNCPETVDLLHAYPNVKAVFHGHDHLLDGVRYSGKLPHFFDSHIGGDWGTEYRGYRVVEIDDNNIIFTYQVNASQDPVLNKNKL